jgi:Uma2 family endonuclease
MTAVAKTIYTEEMYLADELLAPRKREYYNGHAYVMAGASRSHNRVNENLSGIVYRELEGTPCFSLSRDQRVYIQSTRSYVYPDLVIVCGTPEYTPQDSDTLSNPKVIFEILSDKTEIHDRTTKFDHYRRLTSVQEYVLVSQKQPRVELHTRMPDGTLKLAIFEGLDSKLILESVELEIPLAEIYRNVELIDLKPFVGDNDDAHIDREHR